MKFRIILLSIAAFGAAQSSYGALLVTYDFPAANSLVASTVDSSLTATNMALSSSTIAVNQTAGSYFPNEPYVGGSGWTATTQVAAKNFFVTVTAAPGYTFSIENIAFNAYATGAGPSAIGFSVGSAAVYSRDASDSSLMTVNEGVTGQTGLRSVTIKIEGWLNGSRSSVGSGDFRIDDLAISGTVSPIPEPGVTLLGCIGMLGLARRKR